ncbi:MAG TPA: hypothetical protein VLS90_06505, partial [Thermodesulfobacteriota bacterium]|nr:hypothetical protein [Thermodesulfobacteriota bacterium]
RKEKQKEKALAKAKEILEELKKGSDLKKVAARDGYKVEETGFFPRGSAPPKLSPSEDMRKAFGSLSAKTPYPETPLLQDGKYYVLYLKETKEYEKEQLNSQKENYRRALLQMKQETVLNQWLDDLLQQAKARGEYKAYQEINEAI